MAFLRIEKFKVMSTSDAAGNGVLPLPPIGEEVPGIGFAVRGALPNPPSLLLQSRPPTGRTTELVSSTLELHGTSTSPKGGEYFPDCVNNEGSTGAGGSCRRRHCLMPTIQKMDFESFDVEILSVEFLGIPTYPKTTTTKNIDILLTVRRA